MKEITSLLYRKKAKNAIEALWANPILEGVQKAVSQKSSGPKGIILLYHNIVAEPPSNSAYFHKVCLTAAEFRRQMDYLARHSRVISLSRYVAILGNASPKIPGSRPLVIITFDDGYRSVCTEAYPVLKQLGLPATLFVSTGFIGKRTALPGEKPYPGVNYPKLSWEEIGELAGDGFEIGSHTITHAHPGGSTLAQYQDEISRSASEIKSRIGIDPIHFSWPYGKRSPMLRTLEPFLRENGFISASYACGGKNTYSSNPYRLNRIGLSAGISPTHFRRIAEGLSITDLLTRKK